MTMIATVAGAGFGRPRPDCYNTSDRRLGAAVAWDRNN